MKFRTVGAALEKCAAPALAISTFFRSVIDEHVVATATKRRLRRRRDVILRRMICRRDQHGRFVKLAPLRSELASINSQLHAA